MADASEMMTGPARDWLEAKRPELNGRFRLAQRRFPRLQPDAVLALCRELLPQLAGTGEAGSAPLLASAFELILLHAGRGLLAPTGDASPALGELLRVTFPRLRPLLLARPTDLPAALSNAVENFGPRGVDLARGFAKLVDHVSDGDALLDAGAVLAWRLGEARLRTKALVKARTLSEPAVRLALKLDDWPEAAMPLVVAALEADGWRRPDELLSPHTLGELPKRTPAKLVELFRSVIAPPAKKSPWRLAGLLGNFRGFVGHFDEPPVLLDAGAKATRHRFWVRSGTAAFRIDADVFGWVCRPDPVAYFPVRAAKTGAKRAAPLPAADTSCVEGEHLLAFTLADSFRIRVYTPEWRRL